MTLTPNEFQLDGYPTDHLLGILTDVGSLARLMTQLQPFNLAPEKVKVFEGLDGAQRFGGEQRKLRRWLEELSQALTGTTEGRSVYMSALQTGHPVVAIDIKGKTEEKRRIAEALKALGVRDINFLGAMMVETLG